MKFHFSIPTITCSIALILFVGCPGGGKSNPKNPISITISPASVTLETGATQQFTFTVNNSDNKAVEWSVAPGGVGGTITKSGIYTAPISVGTDRVIVTSLADTTKSATATVTVRPGDSVIVSPASAAIYMGASQLFTALTNSENQAVTWSVESDGVGGTITQSGLYTASMTGGTDRVKATSVADPTKSDTATVTVVNPSAATVVINYTNPPAGTGFRFIKNESLSTPVHLVLDLVATGLTSQSTGLAFAILASGSNRVNWGKVSPLDSMLIQNGTVFNLGTDPVGLKSTLLNSQLKAIVSQKGTANLKDLNSGVLARVSLYATPDSTVGDVNFLVHFFQIVSATGEVAHINTTSVSMGALKLVAI
jgi:hypothetical protein